MNNNVYDSSLEIPIRLLILGFIIAALLYLSVVAQGVGASFSGVVKTNPHFDTRDTVSVNDEPFMPYSMEKKVAADGIDNNDKNLSLR